MTAPPQRRYTHPVRRRVATLLAALLAACVQRELRPPPEPRVVQLLAALTAPADAAPDAVLATDDTALLRLLGARARLFGDAEGSRGLRIDGALLIEVLDRKGAVQDRCWVGARPPPGVDSKPAARIAAELDPGEVELTQRLPPEEPFRLRVTAIAAGANARISDVFVLLEPDPGPGRRRRTTTDQ